MELVENRDDLLPLDIREFNRHVLWGWDDIPAIGRKTNIHDALYGKVSGNSAVLLLLWRFSKWWITCWSSKSKSFTLQSAEAVAMMFSSFDSAIVLIQPSRCVSELVGNPEEYRWGTFMGVLDWSEIRFGLEIKHFDRAVLWARDDPSVVMTKSNLHDASWKYTNFV